MHKFKSKFFGSKTFQSCLGIGPFYKHIWLSFFIWFEFWMIYEIMNTLWGSRDTARVGIWKCYLVSVRFSSKLISCFPTLLCAAWKWPTPSADRRQLLFLFFSGANTQYTLDFSGANTQYTLDLDSVWRIHRFSCEVLSMNCCRYEIEYGLGQGRRSSVRMIIMMQLLKAIVNQAGE